MMCMSIFGMSGGVVELWRIYGIYYKDGVYDIIMEYIIL